MVLQLWQIKMLSNTLPPNPSSGGCTESPPPNPTSGDCVLVSSPSTDNDDARSLPLNPPSIVTSGDYIPVSHPSVDYDIKSDVSADESPHGVG